MKLQQGEQHETPKVARLNKLLLLVFLVASIKISLLVGILFFPANLPEFKLNTFKSFILENVANKETKYSEHDLKAIARINAMNELEKTKNTESKTPATQEKASQKIETVAVEQNITKDIPTTITGRNSIFSPKQAYAVENIPPSPNPEVATPNPSPLVPQVAPRQSPIAAEQFLRPDTNSPDYFPSPSVNNPYMPTDTASIKSEEFNRREQELRALEQQTQARIQEMRAIEGQLQSTVDNANNQEDAKIQHLIDMYINMKPRQAAAALAGLDPKIAVKILSGMDGKKAGSILSYMESGAAVLLSEELAKVSF